MKEDKTIVDITVHITRKSLIKSAVIFVAGMVVGRVTRRKHQR